MELINFFLKSLNNREIALAIWILIFILWAFTSRSIKENIKIILKVFFVKKILLSFFCLILYTFLVTVISKYIRFWTFSATKDTLFWFIGVASVLVVNINNFVTDKDYFKKVLLDNLKIMVLVEFIVNLYTFKLIIELISIQVIVFLSVMSGYTKHKPEHKKIQIVFDLPLSIYGILLLIFTIQSILSNYDNFLSFENIRDFLLPIILTIAVVPFIYLMTIYIMYENLFNRIKIFTDDVKIKKYMKRKIFTFCVLNLKRLRNFSIQFKGIKVDNIDEVDEQLIRIINEVKMKL